MKEKIINFLVFIFRIKRCSKDQVFHSWVHEDVKTESMKGTGTYIKGEEIERKVSYTIQERYCPVCRKYEWADPLFGMWMSNFRPKIFEGETAEYVEDGDKIKFIIRKSDEVES